jgi:hypothetical protein
MDVSHIIVLTKDTGATLHLDVTTIEAIADLSTMESQDTGTNVFCASGQVYAVNESAQEILDLVAAMPPATMIGPPGPPGPPGPQGTSGTSTDTFAYSYSSNLVEPPSSKSVEFDTSDITQATKIWTSQLNSDGFDDSMFWLRLVVDDEVIIQLKTQSSVYHRYKITGPVITKSGGLYTEAPVVWESGSGTFSNNASIYAMLLRQGDPGPQGPPGPTAVSADANNKAVLA